VGVETSLRLQLFVYTIQTLPIVGRVDLAAVFFDTARWRQENLFFSKCVCRAALFHHVTELIANRQKESRFVVLSRQFRVFLSPHVC
jgi:hypothetical protein